MFAKRAYTVFLHCNESSSMLVTNQNKFDHQFRNLPDGTRAFEVMVNDELAFDCIYSEAIECRNYDKVLYYAVKRNLINEKSYAIGQCRTYDKYRGQGIYQFALRSILSRLYEHNAYPICMSARTNNFASIRGIFNVGFQEKFTIKRYTFKSLDVFMK